MPVHSDFFFCAAALVLGVVAGMRTTMGLAVFALTLSRRPELAPPVSPVQWFTLPPIAILFALLALGEVIADKLPRTPNRIALGPFVVRLASGAVLGAAVVQLGQLNPWLGAACGAVGAIASTLGMFYARRWMGRATGIRDPFIGAMEDVIAIAVACIVVATLVG